MTAALRGGQQEGDYSLMAAILRGVVLITAPIINCFGKARLILHCTTGLKY